MNSIDVKIANAQRRAAEEKAQAGLAGNRPTPTMNAADVKMIQQDVAKALEAKKASAGAVPLATLTGIVQGLRENRRAWKEREEWCARTPLPEPPPTAEQQAAFFGVGDAPKTYKKIYPVIGHGRAQLTMRPGMEIGPDVPGFGPILALWTSGGRLFVSRNDGQKNATFEIADGIATRWYGAPTSDDPLAVRGMVPSFFDICQTTEG